MITFYCLKFETPPTWRTRSSYIYPPGTGWSSYNPGIEFHFRRLLRLAGLRWRCSAPLSHGIARLHQHKIGYINQAQHKPSARVKTNIKKLHTLKAYHLCPCTVSRLLLKSEYYDNIRKVCFYVGAMQRICLFSVHGNELSGSTKDL
jgi:hypothetical protein